MKAALVSAASLVLSILTLTTSAPDAARAAEALPTGRYAIDPLHTTLAFEIPHLVISSVEGRFESFEGLLVVGETLDRSSVTARAKAASIDTGVADRDEHLRSADFFDVAKYPELVFTSRRITGTPEAITITGDLSIHGATRSIDLTGRYLGSITDGYGQQKIAFDVSGELDRRDFGLVWSQAVEAGPIVGDRVRLRLRVQAALAPAASAK